MFFEWIEYFHMNGKCSHCIYIGGDLVGQIKDETERTEISNAADLCIYNGDMLAVPRWNEKKVCLYKLTKGHNSS